MVMKIFEALRKDHDKQRALVKLIMETQGNSETRQEYFGQLKDELEAHAIAEERHFYGPLLDKDKTVEMSRHGIAEHHQIDKLVDDLVNTDMSSSGWLMSFKKLADKIEHHLAEEEHEFFQQAGKTLTENQKKYLAQDYIDEMQAQ